MKVLVIPSWYPNEADPLWGNYFIKQAEALAEYADISFMNINRVGLREVNKIFKYKKQDGYNDKKYKFKFYEKSILNVKSISVDASYKHYQKMAYKAYKDMIKYTGKPDCILVESSLPAGLAALYIANKEGIPYVLHEHSFDVLNNNIYSKYSKEVVSNAKYVMAVNEKIYNKLKEWNKKVELMPNYIDTKKFDVEDKKKDVFTLLSICNFYKVKALEILLEALARVIYEDGIKDIRLDIVGQGEYKQYYEDISNNFKLQDYVNFVGYVPNEEIPNYLARSHVLCVSSRIETFGIPIVEAFANGKPVITTECGGPNILVDESRGIKVPVDDVDSYKEAIINIKKNYKKYNSKDIKKYAHNYDKEVICKKILDICKKSIDKQ
jgi:glycosyltransferase involved in cell wall biosynthesis